MADKLPHLLFIHVPKTGGQSVRRFMQIARRPLRPGRGVAPFHATALEIKETISKPGWENGVKFATVRNPYDRFASACRQARLNPNSEEAQAIARAKDKTQLKHRLLMRQTDLLIIDGDLAVNKLFKFEDADCHEQIQKFVCEMQNIKLPEDGGPKYPHRNRNKSGELIKLTEETKLWVAGHYAEDFYHFGYSE